MGGSQFNQNGGNCGTPISLLKSGCATTSEVETPVARITVQKQQMAKASIAAGKACPRSFPYVPRLRLEKIQEAQERRKLEQLQARARRVGMEDAVKEADRVAATVGDAKDTFLREQLQKLLVASKTSGFGRGDRKSPAGVDLRAGGGRD